MMRNIVFIMGRLSRFGPVEKIIAGARMGAIGVRVSYML
jgi:hypothetical protein